MKLKRVITVLVVSAMMFSLSGCGGDSSTKKETDKDVHINLAESWKLELFYPILIPTTSANGYGATYYLTNFYDTLVNYEDGKYVGSLAEDWTISDDGKIYTFNIRKGVKFSDNTNLTAEDVAKTLQAASVNLGNYNGTYGKLSTIIKEIKVIDDYKVEMHLKQPYYSTLRDLCLANPYSIVSSEQFNKDLTPKESFKTATYGTGPYMYKGDGDGQTYNFVKNPNYWGKKPNVDSFSIRVLPDNKAKMLALRSGEIDFISGNDKISDESYKEMKDTKGFGAKVDTNAIKTYYLGYNLKHPIFSDKSIRQSISMSIDKDDIIEKIYGGIYEKADALFSKELPYCNFEQTIYSYDLDKSKSILDKAGYKDTNGDGIREKNGKNISADFLYKPGTASDENLILYICDQAKKIGIELKPKSAPMMEWYGMLTGGNYAMTHYFTYGGFFDPTNVINNIDPKVSIDPIIVQISNVLPGGLKLVQELNLCKDEKRIQEIYKIILNTISDNCILTPIQYTRQIVVYNDKIADYVFASDANFTSVQNIILK